jgi:hypothetical protein
MESRLLSRAEIGGNEKKKVRRTVNIAKVDVRLPWK